MKNFLNLCLLLMIVCLSSFTQPQSDCDELRKENIQLQQERDAWQENFSNLRRNHLLMIEKLDHDGLIQCQDFGFYVDALLTVGVPVSKPCDEDERMKY